MKKHLLTTMILLLVILSKGSFAKEALTKTSFKVSGNCDMCKKPYRKGSKNGRSQNSRMECGYSPADPYVCTCKDFGCRY